MCRVESDDPNADLNLDGSDHEQGIVGPRLDVIAESITLQLQITSYIFV